MSESAEADFAPGVRAAAARLVGKLAPGLLFMGVALVLSLTATRGVASVDTTAPAAEAWHIAVKGSPWLEAGTPDALSANPWIHEVANGHVVADRMAGPVLLSLPFYWFANQYGMQKFSMVPAGIASAFATAGTTLLLFLALRPRLGQRSALLVSLAFCFGTPTWAVSGDAPWTHTVTQLGLAGTAFAAGRRSWWLAGAFAGLAMFGRPHVAVVAAVIGLGESWTRRRWRPALQVGVTSATALLLLLCWNRLIFGVWSPVSAGYRGHVETLVQNSMIPLVNYLGFFVSPDRGFLVWTPIFLVMVPAVVRRWTELPSWSKWLALGGATYTMLQLRLNVFSGGDAFFGYRLGLELATCLAPMYAFGLRGLRRPGRVLALLALALQAGAMFVGATAKGLFVSAPEVWRDNALLWGFRAAPGLVTVAFGSVALAVLALGYLLHVRATSTDEAPDGYVQAIPPGS